MLNVIARGGLGLLVAASLVAACAGPSAPPSFDPSTPCGGADRQEMTGAYPDLEARIPLALDGQAADSRESGRFCSKATLGKFWDAGIREEQFGGGIRLLQEAHRLDQHGVSSDVKCLQNPAD